MNKSEFLNEVEKSFNLNEKDVSSLLDVKLETYKEFKKGIANENLEEKVFDALSIKEYPKNIDKLPTKLKIRIDNKKYKNPLSMYSEVLKCFKKDDNIFVLTKFKQKNKMSTLFDLFLNNTKESVLKEMNNFSPSFLIERKDKNLLVSIGNNFLVVDILPDNIKTDTFIYEKYRYRKANKIELK